MGTANLTNSGSALSMLLNLYMTGRISEALWKRTMGLMDADGTTAKERMALARYVRDVVSEKGSDQLFMPRIKELNDLLSGVRHA